MRLTNLRVQVQTALSGEAVPQLNIKGNTFTLIYEGNKKVVSKLDNTGRMYVDVHIVDAATSISKMYWEKRYSNDEGEQVAPDCFSEDGVEPSIQSTNKQSEYCSQCPWNVWGTSIGDQGQGKGKRCRDIWKIAIIVPEFSPEAIFQFRIPPNSLKFWKAYMAQFQEITIEEEDNREAHPGDVITRIFFEPDMQGTVNFEGVSYISDTQKNYLGYITENDLAAKLIGLDTDAPALPAPALPAPAAKKQIAAPAKQIEKPKPAGLSGLSATKSPAKAVQEAYGAPEEEDEEAAYIAKMQAELAQRTAAAQAKKAAAAQPAQTKSSVGQPRAVATGVPRGAVALDAGMRTKTGAPASTAGMSRMQASIARQTAEEAELVEEQIEVVEQPKAIMKKERPINTPEGIPSTNLPGELSALLAGVMGS